jgi:hypothetical protein
LIILILFKHNLKFKLAKLCKASPLVMRIWMKSAGSLVRTKKKKRTVSTMTMTSIRIIDLIFNIFE